MPNDFTKDILKQTGKSTDAAVIDPTDTTATQHAKETGILTLIVSALASNLAYEFTVTTATDTTHLKATALVGKGNTFFAGPTPWSVFITLDAGLAGAAPQGEMRAVVAFTSSDGTLEHATFSAQTGVGDKGLMLHPAIARILNTTDGLSALKALIDAGFLAGAKASVVGALNDAAATGVVTDTDTAMAYIKQLVTSELARDTDVAKIPHSDGTATFNATALGSINAEVDTALNTIVPAAPTAGSLNDALSKASGGNTFNKATDSLEAIGEDTDALIATIGVAGAGLTAIPAPTGIATSAELAKVPKSDGAVSWNATALAAIQTAAQAAITASSLATSASLGAVGDTATAADLSDIATTTAQSKLRRALLWLKDLTDRITTARAGYLDNLSGGAVALASNADAKTSEVHKQVCASADGADSIGKLLKDNLNAPVGNIPTTAMRGTDNAALATNITVPTADATDNTVERDVIGNKADAAQTTVGTTRSLMGYLKGVLTNLTATRAGYLDNLSAGATSLATSDTVPTADANTNTLSRDVVGNKTDAAVVAVGTTKSLMAHLKGVMTMLIKPAADGTGNTYVADVVGSKDDTANQTVGTTSSLMRYVKALLTNYTTTRAGYIDNLSGGAVALASKQILPKYHRICWCADSAKLASIAFSSVAADKDFPTVAVPSGFLPTGVTITAVYPVLRWRKMWESSGAWNAVNGASKGIYVKVAAGAWGTNDIAAILLIDNDWTMSPYEEASGMFELVSPTDIKSVVTTDNLTFNFRSEQTNRSAGIVVDGASMTLYGVQMGLKYWYTLS